MHESYAEILLPGSSEKTCYLVPKARVVGMFHDGHELDTVVTLTQRAEDVKTSAHFIYVLRAFQS